MTFVLAHKRSVQASSRAVSPDENERAASSLWISVAAIDTKSVTHVGITSPVAVRPVSTVFRGLVVVCGVLLNVMFHKFCKAF